MSGQTGSAAVIGVGAVEGLGARLARKFAVEGGYHALLGGRTAERLEEVAADIGRAGGKATSVRTDATSEEDVINLFDRAEAAAIGPLEVAIFNAGGNRPRPTLDSDTAFFQDMLLTNCQAGFVFGREAARRMAPRGRGTIIFTGASASLRGKPNFIAFAAAKAGLRAVAQSLAREFGPQGIHVAHVVIDGAISGDRVRQGWPALISERGEDGLLSLDGIAEAYWQLHRQPPSTWTHEQDLRPFREVW